MNFKVRNRSASNFNFANQKWSMGTLAELFRLIYRSAGVNEDRLDILLVYLFSVFAGSVKVLFNLYL